MTEKKRGRPKGEPLVQVLSMKGTAKWRAWLERWANHLGLSSSQAIDRAIKKTAKQDGFDPPPDRTGEDDA